MPNLIFHYTNALKIQVQSHNIQYITFGITDESNDDANKPTCPINIHNTRMNSVRFFVAVAILYIIL